MIALFTASGIILLILAGKVMAKTNVKIENNSGSSSVSIQNSQSSNINTDSKTSTRNYVEVNGKIYVDENTTSADNNESSIDVNISNGQGTIKYKSNGNEKNIQVDPEGDNTKSEEKQDQPAKSSEQRQNNSNRKNTEKGLYASIVSVLVKIFEGLSSVFGISGTGSK